MQNNVNANKYGTHIRLGVAPVKIFTLSSILTDLCTYLISILIYSKINTSFSHVHILNQHLFALMHKQRGRLLFYFNFFFYYFCGRRRSHDLLTPLFRIRSCGFDFVFEFYSVLIKIDLITVIFFFFFSRQFNNNVSAVINLFKFIYIID